MKQRSTEVESVYVINEISGVASLVHIPVYGENEAFPVPTTDCLEWLRYVFRKPTPMYIAKRRGDHHYYFYDILYNLWVRMNPHKFSIVHIAPESSRPITAALAKIHTA